MKLIKFYKNIKNNKVNFFFETSDIYKEISKNYKYCLDRKSILELGCGNLSHFHFFKKNKFKKYTAVDWVAFNNRELLNDNRLNIKISEISNFLKKSKEKFDCVLLLGTLEHFDDTKKIICLIKKVLNKNGKLIISVPNYFNPRGLVLLTLKYLMNLKVSLSDKQEFTVNDIIKVLKKYKFTKTSIKTIRPDGAYKKLAIKDLRDRIPKILGKKKILKKNLDKFIYKFINYTKFYTPNKFSGQVLIIKTQLA
jgi:SAM-dependent methyltransferase